MGKLLGIYYYSESRPVAIVQLKTYKNPQSGEREREVKEPLRQREGEQDIQNKTVIRCSEGDSLINKIIYYKTRHKGQGDAVVGGDYGRGQASQRVKRLGNGNASRKRERGIQSDETSSSTTRVHGRYYFPLVLLRVVHLGGVKIYLPVVSTHCTQVLTEGSKPHPSTTDIHRLDKLPSVSSGIKSKRGRKGERILEGGTRKSRSKMQMRDDNSIVTRHNSEDIKDHYTVTHTQCIHMNM